VLSYGANGLFILLYIYLIFKKEFLYSNPFYISLLNINCKISIVIGTISEFSQILLISPVAKIRDYRRVHLGFATSIAWRRPEN
jgi:hypothetical protein